jgi:peroxiredoxin
MPAAMPTERNDTRQRRHLLRTLGGLALIPTLALTGCEQSSEKWPAKGDAFPVFSLPNLDDQISELASYAGQPMLVNFWATWCPPCRKEMADLEQLHLALSPRGLRMIAISVDEDINLVREFVHQRQLSFTVLIDAGQNWLRTALRIPGFPTTYLLDAKHTIADVMIGPREWAQADVQQTLAAKINL